MSDHAHTDYEKLLSDGYDNVYSRFFVMDHVNATLTCWHSTHLLKPDDEKV